MIRTQCRGRLPRTPPSPRRRRDELRSFHRCRSYLPRGPTFLFGFPLLEALLVPDRSHSKLAVGARYASEVPPRQVGKHCVTLEAQPPAQCCGIQDLVVLRYLYPIKLGLLYHDWHHTEIIDEPRECIDKNRRTEILSLHKGGRRTRPSRRV